MGLYLFLKYYDVLYRIVLDNDDYKINEIRFKFMGNYILCEIYIKIESV